MLLIEYIENHYGNKRGNKASFLRDNETILPQELNRWLNANLKINIETGEIYKPTSKPVRLKKKPVAETGILSQKTNIKLKTCAERVNMTAEPFINYLLDDEIERNQILDLSQDIEQNESTTPVQVIAEIVNRHFSVLSHTSEIYEYQMVLEKLINELLDKRLLNLRVSENCIAESQRLKIPRAAYYWYGGIIANRITKMLGAWEIYLWHELYNTESESVFLGSPNNVVACYLICERVCKLLKKTRTTYKKDQGDWGSRREVEDAANDYIYRFVQGIMETDNYMYDEESQMRLIGYAREHYRYAMDQ